MDKPKPLTADERDDLRDVLEHPGLKGLLYELELLTVAIENDVLRFDLISGDERALVRTKCRAEGARKLQNAFESRIRGLRAKAAQGQKPDRP